MGKNVGVRDIWVRVLSGSIGRIGGEGQASGAGPQIPLGVVTHDC